MIGAAAGGEQGLEDVLDLTEADAGGEGDGGHLAELGRIADDRELGGSAQGVDLIAKPLILGEEFVVGGGVEALLELASVLVDRLAATASLLGLVGDRPIDLGEDGGGVADQVERGGVVTGRSSGLLAILVVTQSITGWPPLQDKLSTRSSHCQPALRQSQL